MKLLANYLTQKFDAICENLPYGATNSVVQDQLFSYVCGSING